MIYHSTILLNVKGPQDFYPFKICYRKKNESHPHGIHSSHSLKNQIVTVLGGCERPLASFPI